jgi:hypothetical protein
MSGERFGLRPRVAGLTVVAAVAAALIIVPLALAGAINTTTDPGQTVNGKTTLACINGPDPSVNCNIYEQKEDVFLSGSPISASLGAGTYFFAVLEPGGQPNPNDGSAKNLSSPKDDAADREFSINGSGVITNLGNHLLDGNKLSAFDYDNTTNNGGVYIMAVCKISSDQNATAITVPTVDAHNCKYDAFKVRDSTVNDAADLVVTKTATPTFTRDYDWSVTKTRTSDSPVHTSSSTTTVDYTVTATWSGPSDSGWKVEGTISVLNPNGFAVSGVKVTDEVDNGGVCTVTDGTDATIPKDTSVDFDYSCTYDSVPDPLAGTNTALATWDPSGDLSGTTGSADFPLGFTFDDGSTDNPAVTHDTTTVTDTFNSGTADTLGVANIDGTFAIDGGNSLADWTDSYDGTSNTFTFTYSRSAAVVAGTCTKYANTAAVSDDATAGDNSASASVTACGGADLTASKTASGGFTRTYKWTIAKSVTGSSLVRVAYPGNATFNYSVVVNSGSPAYVDSGWQVTGSITVYNPNDWEAVTVGITDAIGTGWTCVVTNGTGVSVPAATDATHPGSASRNYTCSYTGTGTPSGGTNTATVTWNSTTASTPNGSATGTATFSFTSPSTEVNKTINITDTFNGSPTPTTLGSVTYGVTTLPKTFSYQRTIAVGQLTCASYPNIATITETLQTSSATVRVCPTVTGLTIGFWQNKNGQARITGAGPSSGTCSLTAALRAYAPFQDLSATATCAQVATYVSTVIKAANSSGSSMNAMLKAQMLATALNVWVSPSATNGGESIDLTKVCKMIDGNSGTATCSGTYQNVSAAFGGATSMTVLQILAYAAGQSNSGGSTWYGQAKATQEMAKNVFDAINNGVALSA